MSNPDEAYVDDRGARHTLKRSSMISDYLVVIYEVGKGGGFIRTAYFIVLNVSRGDIDGSKNRLHYKIESKNYFGKS